MKRTITTLLSIGAVGSAAVLGSAYFGLVNVGADDTHFPAVHAFLAMARDRSIEVRARNIKVPNLKDPALVKAGAGNYNAMCIGCHLAPGLQKTELSQALYPAPANLSKSGVSGGPATAFWIIKHGIKATGMPAWGKSMEDQYIWGIVAFLDQLPQLNAEEYQAMVASSGGHQHGGGESDMHDHEGQHGSAKSEQGTREATTGHGMAEEGHDRGSAHSEPVSLTEHHGGHQAAEAPSDHRTGHSSKNHVHEDGKAHTQVK